MAGVDFFISHAGPDRAWAEWVAWHLREAGYTVELDAWNWGAGDNFVTRMHAAVEKASQVIALLSPAYFAAGCTADEWSAALVKDERTGGHRLMPVQVQRCSVPLLLRPLLRVELFDVPEPEAVRRLLAAVRGPRPPDEAPLFPGRGLQDDTIGYRRRVLGENHPLTINATTELGTILRALGQVEDARRLHEMTLVRARRVLGEDHLWTMNCQRELAVDLHALGDFEAARRLSEDTLARARRVLGDDRRFTLDVADNLASDLHALGEHEPARQLGEDTLARARRVLGDTHPLTQRATANLAAIRHALSDEPNCTPS